MINAYDMHFKVYTVPQTLHDFSEQANMYLIDRILFMITAIYNMIDPALCGSVTRVWMFFTFWLFFLYLWWAFKAFYGLTRALEFQGCIQ